MKHEDLHVKAATIAEYAHRGEGVTDDDTAQAIVALCKEYAAEELFSVAEWLSKPTTPYFYADRIDQKRVIRSTYHIDIEQYLSKRINNLKSNNVGD